MPKVIAVAKNSKHGISKISCPQIELLPDLGVKDDAHCGKFIQHRSRMLKNPEQINLRQVHVLHSEFLSELANMGFMIEPGDIGENITTAGLDVLALPKDTRLYIGDAACIKITGLRNPCAQLNGLAYGLMNACIYRNKDGEVIRKAGIMGVVEKGGLIFPGAAINVHYPNEPWQSLAPV